MGEEKTLNLAQRHLAAMGSVDRVVKRGQTEFGERFKYAKHDDVMAAVRPALVEHGLDLIVDIDPERTNVQDWLPTRNGAPQRMWTVWARFTLVNADDESQRRISVWPGEGIDTGDKGFGKAVSYATKNYLLKTFLLPAGDEADNEAHDVAGGPQRGQAAPRGQAQQAAASGETKPPPTPEQTAMRKFWATSKKAGLEKETIMGWLQRNLGIDSTRTATVEQLTAATIWANSLESNTAAIAAAQAKQSIPLADVATMMEDSYGTADMRLLTPRQAKDLVAALEAWAPNAGPVIGFTENAPGSDEEPAPAATPEPDPVRDAPSGPAPFEKKQEGGE